MFIFTTGVKLLRNISFSWFRLSKPIFSCKVLNHLFAMTRKFHYSSFSSAKPDAPSNCQAGNATSSGFEVLCTEGFDGGSAVTFDLQFVADGVYHSVLKSDVAHSNITSQQSGTYYVMRMCASNEEYPDEDSCSPEFNVTTTGM